MIDNFQYDGTTLPDDDDNVGSDGNIVTAVKADGVTYWEKEVGPQNGDVVALTSYTQNVLALFNGFASASITFKSNGDVQSVRVQENNPPTPVNTIEGQWVFGSFAASDYEIEVLSIDPDFSSPSGVGTYNLGTDVTFAASVASGPDSIFPVATCVIREIAQPANSVVLAIQFTIVSEP